MASPSKNRVNVMLKASAFEDLLTCPICFSIMQKATLTKCGHTYCAVCISECVDRLHKCPVCNSEVTASDFFADRTLDHLISVFKEERTVGEKKYFDNLLESATSTERVAFSPVEQVLKHHLKASLEAHERYYQNLKQDMDHYLEELERDTTEKLKELQIKETNPEMLERETKKLRLQQENNRCLLQKEMNNCAVLVANAYDRYLKERLPELCVLPMQVTVTYPAKDVQLQNIVLQPTDTAQVVLNWIERQLYAMGDEVIKKDPDPVFFCFGPFSKRPREQLVTFLQHLAEGEVPLPAGVTRLAPHAGLMLQHSIKAGSEIVLVRGLRCRSDLPQRCFTVTFRPEEKTTVDYFQCADCNFKWICKACAGTCHKDHGTSLYIKNHVPEWACCYCPKKKKCRINIKDAS